MSISYTSTYIAKSGDTLKQIARAFRLSSYRALVEIPGNAHIGNIAVDATLEIGTRISIPPNAGDLLKERLYVLHAVRPLLLAHFDKQVTQAEADLRGVALAGGIPSTPSELSRALAGMQALVAEDMQNIAQACVTLARIGQGIAETHVASADDRSIRGSTVGEMTGLYWMLSGRYVGVWADMWSVELWSDKWQGKDIATAWRATDQHLNTIRSVVVQQADARIRETLALEASLLTEA
jgi:hypothetical protein